METRFSQLDKLKTAYASDTQKKHPPFCDLYLRGMGVAKQGCGAQAYSILSKAMCLDHNADFFDSMIDFNGEDRKLMALIATCKEEMVAFCKSYNENFFTHFNPRDVLRRCSFLIWEKLAQAEQLDVMLFIHRINDCILLMQDRLNNWDKKDDDELVDLNFLSGLVQSDLLRMECIDSNYETVKKFFKNKKIIIDLMIQLNKVNCTEASKNLSLLMNIMKITQDDISREEILLAKKKQSEIEKQKKERTQTEIAQKNQASDNKTRADHNKINKGNRNNTKKENRNNINTENPNPINTHIPEFYKNNKTNQSPETVSSMPSTQSSKKSNPKKKNTKKDRRNKISAPIESNNRSNDNSSVLWTAKSQPSFEEKKENAVRSKDTYIYLSTMEQSFLQNLKSNKNTIKAYFVGGLVRGRILNHDYVPNDYDIVTNASETEIFLAYPAAKKIGDSLYRIMVKECRLEIWKNEQIDQLFVDAQSRDFTINALYADATGLIYDPLMNMGVTNLRSHTLATTKSSELSFNEDPVRLLRLVNLLTQHVDLKMSEGIVSSCNSFSVSLKADTPDNRKKIQSFNSYLNKLFSHGRAYDNLLKLKEMRLLSKLFPEIPEPLWDDPWLLSNLNSIDTAFSYSKIPISVLNNIFLSMLIILEESSQSNITLLEKNIFFKVNFMDFDKGTLETAKSVLAKQRQQYYIAQVEKEKEKPSHTDFSSQSIFSNGNNMSEGSDVSYSSSPSLTKK